MLLPRSNDVEPLRVRLFGTPLVTYGGKPVRFVAARTLQLLAYLLLGRDRPIARDQLAYKFWPDSSEAEARANLRRHLHRINGPLDDVSGRRWFETSDKAIAFDSKMPLDLDVARLEAADPNAPDASAVVDLYAGELFEGCDEEWLIPHRERLRTAYLRLLAGLVDRYRGERRFAEAIALSRKILDVDPFREDALRTLMSLQYESGDRSSALAEFQGFRERLQLEIGTDPMRETQSLHDAIRRHAAVSARQADRPPQERAMPFVGRDDEIEALGHAWRQAAAGKGRVTLVSGEAGIGKTRLLREFTTIAQREGARVLWGASSFPEAAPYEPVIEALTSAISEICRLSLAPAMLSALAVRFPELRAMRSEISQSVGLNDDRERERLFDAVAFAIEALCTTRPTVLVFDDLHWARADTFALITRITQTCVRSPLFVIIAFREEETTAALRAFRFDPATKHASRLGLGRLDAAACSTIVRLGYEALSPSVGDWAIGLAKGNPLFLSELVRQYAGRASGDPHDSALLPTTLETAILTRLATLSQAARSLIDIAAIGGAVVSIDVLQYACGWPLAEVLDATDELVEQFVLRETATGSRGDYEFAHDLIRDAVVRSMPSDLQARRHRRFAKAILHTFPTRQDEFARALAQHFEKAGQPEEAARFYARAANVARDQYAWQDGITFAEHALRLEKQPRERFSLHGVIESAALMRGDGDLQNAAIATMREIADDLGDTALRAIALQRSSEFALRTGDFERQRLATDELESIAIERDDKSMLRNALRCRARAEIVMGRPEAGVAAMQKIDAIAHLDRSPTEWIADLLVLAFAQGVALHFEAAEAAIVEAERRAGSTPTPSDELMIVLARTDQALQFGERSEAARLTPLLLELARRIGDVEREATAHYCSAKVAEWAFDIASARHHLRAASVIFERIGKLQALVAASVNAGWIEYQVGLLDDAERFYAEALGIADRLESPKHRSIIFGNLAHVALLRGDAESALAEAERALQIARDLNDPQLIVWNLVLTGTARFQLGRDADRSLTCFMEALELCERFGFTDDRLELAAAAIPTLIAFEKHERALAFATEIERAISADAGAVVMPVFALMNVADVYDAVADDAAARAVRARARSLLHERLEKLPDERTRAAYAALPVHRALIDAAATRASVSSL
jgi:DNA-binding SARP family transcriptional activator